MILRSMVLRWLLAALLMGFVLAGAGGARAQDGTCAALLDPAAVSAAVGGPADRSTVQSGLRVVFGVDSGFLSDGILGPITLSYLEELCRSVPLAEGSEPVAGTIDLAREYAALSRWSPNWPARLAEAAMLEPVAAGDGFDRFVVRLAGPAQTTGAALNGVSDAAGCAWAETADLELGADGLAALRAGLTALLEADPDLSPRAALLEEQGAGPETRAALAAVCAVYPAEGPEALSAELQRLGRISMHNPGAPATLGSPAFARWLAESQAVRVGRLLGTEAAVLRLLDDFAGAAPQEVQEVADIPACAAPDETARPTYFSLTAEDVEILAARASLGSALAPVAAERFASRTDLLAAVNGALGVSPPDCGAQQIAATVERHEMASIVHGLDGERLETLALRPGYATVEPALTPLASIESPSRETLVEGIKAAIRDSLQASMGEAASQAADAASVAAEDVSPAPDQPAPGIPAAEAGERAEEFAITDGSLLVLEEQIPDPEMFAAINATPYKPMESRELVRTDMLVALQPLVAGRAEIEAGEWLDELMPALRQRWRLDESVIAELSADPAFAPIDPEALASIGEIAGIAYPDRRLFEQALASLSLPIDAAATGAILDAARKRVDDPYARHDIAPIAADCGCNVTRRDHSQVYAFYPFWDLAGAGDAEAPRIDYDLVGRIAFDGLVIGADGMLAYAAQWNDAAATFIASAHRHQAKVDLAIRLRGWRDWTQDQTRLAASAVVEELGRTHPEEKLVASNGPLGWLDRYVDRSADGVTLIVEDYTGAPDAARADKLIELVRMIGADIERNGQTINLAFDLPLLDETTHDAPLLQDLRSLIVNTAEPEERHVRNILVFLERPTTRTKKILRARIESSFKGEERIQVLRSIIPVVPPGANATLHPQQPDGILTTETSEANSYGQFRDDLVYFQDNFDGIGFWPAPAVGATLADGSPDELAEIVAGRYYDWQPPLVPERYQGLVRGTLDGACSLVCPSRVAFYIVAAATAGLVLAAGGLSLYSGRARALAHRLLLIPLLLLGLLGLLMVTATCDTDSRSWSLLALLALMLLTSASLAFHWYQRRVDGPMP